MAIEIKEVFHVQAPIDAVWQFVMDPHKVVTCMPGAKLDEVVDDRTFMGSVHVKVGAVTTSYKGRVQFTKLDPQAHVVELSAEGRETGGGLAKARMSSTLQAVAADKTEVVVEATVDLTGRIMQVGRGMIQGVSHQLFLQFVNQVKKQLGSAGTAAPPGATAAAGTTAAASPAPQPIRVVPLLLRVIWSAITNFFRKLLGR